MLWLASVLDWDGSFNLCFTKCLLNWSTTACPNNLEIRDRFVTGRTDLASMGCFNARSNNRMFLFLCWHFSSYKDLFIMFLIVGTRLSSKAYKVMLVQGLDCIICSDTFYHRLYLFFIKRSTSGSRFFGCLRIHCDSFRFFQRKQLLGSLQNSDAVTVLGGCKAYFFCEEGY